MVDHPEDDGIDWTARAANAARYLALYRCKVMGAIWSAGNGYKVAPPDAPRGASHHLAEFMTFAAFKRKVDYWFPTNDATIVAADFPRPARADNLSWQKSVEYMRERVRP